MGWVCMKRCTLKTVDSKWVRRISDSSFQLSVKYKLKCLALEWISRRKTN